uniref:ZP domain-containing protein n=1 Tax=Panagrolaimus sp. PS1159 TaxID=55785 RepID=A0AC35G1F5_9BILA
MRIKGFWFLICLFLLFQISSAKFPNEIADVPIVSCESDKILIKIRTTASNPSHIYAEDFRDNSGCQTRNMNNIAILHGECGMTSEKLSNPDGIMYRICVSVQIHPLFVTESDRSYCAQCVYMDTTVVNDLQQNLAISDALPNELEPQFDETSNPQCSYTIRKGSVDGPEIHFATIGDSVFHVWQCQNEHVGILVQNCHVEDLEGNKILIIDQNGCGIDQYVLNTPQYNEDLKLAYQESHVFKFADKTLTRFTCQIRLCMKDRKNGCDKITPPRNCKADGEVVDSDVGKDQPLPPAKLTASPDLLKAETIGPPSITPPNHQHTKTIGRTSNKSSSSSPSSTVVINGIPAAQRGVTNVNNNPQQSSPSAPASSYAGYGGYRSRRAHEIQANATTPLIRQRRVPQNIPTTPINLPQMDVVGVIRVLDSPEDVEYFESKLSSDPLNTLSTTTREKKCMSTSLYWSLIATLILLITIQIIALSVIALDRLFFESTISTKFKLPSA